MDKANMHSKTSSELPGFRNLANFLIWEMETIKSQLFTCKIWLNLLSKLQKIPQKIILIYLPSITLKLKLKKLSLSRFRRQLAVGKFALLKAQNLFQKNSLAVLHLILICKLALCWLEQRRLQWNSNGLAKKVFKETQEKSWRNLQRFTVKQCFRLFYIFLFSI